MKINVMPRNPNLRIDLECDQGKWKFTLCDVPGDIGSCKSVAEIRRTSSAVQTAARTARTV